MWEFINTDKCSFKVTVLRYIIIDEIVLFLHTTTDGFRVSELYTGATFTKFGVKADGKTPDEAEKNLRKILSKAGTESVKKIIKDYVNRKRHEKRFFELD